MTNLIRAKIKNRDQFKRVFPLPIDGDNNLARFILSILGQTIYVKKVRSQRGTFYYISEIDSRFVIMPNWIEYFDAETLVLTNTCIAPLILEDGTVVILGR